MTSWNRWFGVAMVLVMTTAPVLSAPNPDLSESVRHWNQDAVQGNARAQYFLGLAYMQGRGVAIDYARAHFWFSLAAAGNEPGARASLERLMPRLTPAQMRKARQLMREWSAKSR